VCAEWTSKASTAEQRATPPEPEGAHAARLASLGEQHHGAAHKLDILTNEVRESHILPLRLPCCHGPRQAWNSRACCEHVFSLEIWLSTRVSNFPQPFCSRAEVSWLTRTVTSTHPESAARPKRWASGIRLNGLHALATRTQNEPGPSRCRPRPGLTLIELTAQRADGMDGAESRCGRCRRWRTT